MAERNAIGIVELSSIAAGFAVTDAMLKAGDVEVLVARTICSGKYLSMIGGSVSDPKERLLTLAC
jgi:microcompartment protein CcmL/EutN